MLIMNPPVSYCQDFHNTLLHQGYHWKPKYSAGCFCTFTNSNKLIPWQSFAIMCFFNTASTL